MKEQLKVILQYEGKDQTTAGFIDIQTWDKKERLKRSIIILLKCFLGAIVAIPFPIVHFLLVPGLIVGGIIFSLITFNQEKIILGGSGICPNCGKDLKIERGKFIFPTTELCTNCRKNILVSL